MYTQEYNTYFDDELLYPIEMNTTYLIDLNRNLNHKRQPQPDTNLATYLIKLEFQKSRVTIENVRLENNASQVWFFQSFSLI